MKEEEIGNDIRLEARVNREEKKTVALRHGTSGITLVSQEIPVFLVYYVTHVLMPKEHKK